MLLGPALLGACATDGSASDDRPLVVTTTTMLGDLVTAVGGETVRVETLMPPGADPHDFEASVADAALMRSAALVVANGLGLEERLDGALDAARADGVRIWEVAPLVDPLPFGVADADVIAPDNGQDGSGQDESTGHDHSHDHSHDQAQDPESASADEDASTAVGIESTEHDHGDLDPHFWMDPDRMAIAAELLATELAEATDRPIDTFGAAAAEFAAEARDAAIRAEEILAVVPSPRRLLISDHDALGYFAARFGFSVIGTVIPGGSTLGEPSAAEIARLTSLIRATGVGAIFADSTVPSSVVDTLAREVGGSVTVVSLYAGSLGPAGSEAATYPGMILADARSVADGLAPGA